MVRVGRFVAAQTAGSQMTREPDLLKECHAFLMALREWQPLAASALRHEVDALLIRFASPASAPAAETCRIGGTPHEVTPLCVPEPVAPASLPTKAINQCDGCRNGYPFSDDGRYHQYPESGRTYQACTREKYEGKEPVAPADLRDERIAELERCVEAGLRLAKYRYRFWASSGGHPECAHGINLGIYCARCDMLTLTTGAERIAKVAALADGGEAPR